LSEGFVTQVTEAKSELVAVAANQDTSEEDIVFVKVKDHLITNQVQSQ
jgi:hypothetical protein